MREIAALSSHYPVSTKSPAEQARWLDDFANDLGDAGPEAVAAACRAWRLGDAKRFPTPGQLRKLVTHTVRALSAPNHEAWRPISDEEYDSLTVHQRARHQRILASEAFTKAGPMWKGGAPAGPDELPETWHRWRGIARNHLAEAQRLEDVLKARTMAA